LIKQGFFIALYFRVFFGKIKVTLSCEMPLQTGLVLISWREINRARRFALCGKPTSYSNFAAKIKIKEFKVIL
jgi:hypothetical protein